MVSIASPQRDHLRPALAAIQQGFQFAGGAVHNLPDGIGPGMGVPFGGAGLRVPQGLADEVQAGPV